MKNPTSRDLSMRDPVLAALLGVGAVGAMATRSPAGREANFGADYGQFGFGQFGDDPAALANMHPAAQVAAAQQIIQQNAQRQSYSQNRSRLLNPNEGSDIKVEGYSFSLNTAVTALGTAQTVAASASPTVNIRPKRVTMNAPAPGFITIDKLQVANVLVTVGATMDAFECNANGVGQEYDMPTLTPSNPASYSGNYTAFTPPGYTIGAAYLFVVTFKGPATMTA